MTAAPDDLIETPRRAAGTLTGQQDFLASTEPMPTAIARYLTPWKLKRERAAERVRVLRGRDGDNCARCRRPLRFDLPEGHDQAAKIEPRPAAPGDDALAALCLCHTRCNAGKVDHTGDVAERMRRKAEAELFAKTRGKKRRAA
jgi:hypothetical protein